MKKQSLMNILTLALTIGFACLWSSCTKLGQNLRFSLPMQTGSVNISIPPTSALGTYTFGPASNIYNVDSFIKANTANQLGISNIKSVKLTSLTITINNPSQANNFANFSSCSASFWSNANTNHYMLNVASNPDNYSYTLALPVDTTVDLSSYLGNQFNYSLQGTLRRAVTDSMNCTISYGFNVVVQG